MEAFLMPWLWGRNCKLKTKMQKAILKPSDYYLVYPTSSRFKDGQCEIVAENIMIILQRTGDAFRELTWDEYAAERIKDTDFTQEEKIYFNKVKRYCASAEKASTFSSEWKNIKPNGNKN